MKRTSAAAVVVAAAIALISTKAEASSFVIGGQIYNESALSETVNATFTTPDGGVTTNLYHGLVELIVSGTGQSAGADHNDAFYVYDTPSGPMAPAHDSQYYQVTTGDTPLAPLTPSQDVTNFIVFDITTSSDVLTRPYVPGYEASHVYGVIIDLSLLGASAPSLLHFGVSDGIFSDNSGNYEVAVTQLEAVPEPASMLLLGSGLTLLARRARRSRKQTA